MQELKSLVSLGENEVERLAVADIRTFSKVLIKECGTGTSIDK